MYDFIGIIALFILGFLLIISGNNIPDQADIILENKVKITNLGGWNCGEDITCQKSQDNSIRAINLSLASLEVSQNLRNSLLWIGGIFDVLAIIGIVLRVR